MVDISYLSFILNAAGIIILVLYLLWNITKPVVIDTQKYIFAYIHSNVLSVGINNKLAKRKETLFAPLYEQEKNAKSPLQVLDVGTGDGRNFKHFPQGMKVTCLEPNDHFRKYILTHAKKYNVEVKGFIKAYAEDMSKIPSGSFDAVVVTLVLCSVKDVKKSLSEIKRVLKPGGQLFYIEHVASKELLRLLFQKLLHLLSYVLFDGCILDRDTGKFIKEAGFTTVKQTDFFAAKLRDFTLTRPHIMGVATK